MFSSFFSTTDPTAQNFHPVSSRVPPSELFGELTPKDTEWLCPGGISVETQVWYTILEDGTSFWCQIIHSSTGLWYPTIQFTCKIYNPKTKQHIWKSVNINNFVTPPPGLDKRSAKADEFTVTHKSAPGSDFPESYTISANLGTDLQIFLEVSRLASAPGYKVGKGEKGGYSYFGADTANPEGFVIHRFWPLFKASGHLVISGQAVPAQGNGMFVHAIQGMRPNLVASRWNFAHFLSTSGDASAIQMDFTTIDAYGKKGAGSGGVTVSVGSLVLDKKLVAVTTETKWPGEAQAAEATVKSRAEHRKLHHDSETGYDVVPSEISFTWAGPSLLKDAPGNYSAFLNVDVGDAAEPKGLVQKVDVMGEIPRVVKAAVAYTGTKPYIYQWLNQTKLTVTGPDAQTEIEGTLYNEATFIS